MEPARSEPAGVDELLARALALPAVAALIERLGTDFAPRVLLVGGAVRDLLLGEPVLDLDVAVEGPVQEVVTRLAAPARGHGRFGTATVTIDGDELDLARTRRETYARPGALPDVEPAEIGQDLRRRDFTVNALALPLTGAGAGRLISVPEALPDLERRWLRVLHERSFIDDPTRLLRLARYRARLGFTVEPGTLRLAREAVGSGALATLTGSRIGSELELLSGEADPGAAWEALHELGVDAAIEPGFGLEDPGLARRALGLLPADGSPAVVLLALALRGVPVQRRAALLDRLALAARLRDGALDVSTCAQAAAEALRRARRASEIAAAVGAGERPELAAVAGALGAEAPARRWLQQLRELRLEITGEDLKAEGLVPGPAIGAGLAAARAALLDGAAPTRREQLAEALRVASRTPGVRWDRDPGAD